MSLPKASLLELDICSSDVVFKQLAFKALQQQSCFVVSHLNTLFPKNGIANLFLAYDDFLRQTPEEQKPYQSQGTLTEPAGFHPYGSFFAGSRACHRFCISRDAAGQVICPLPPTKHTLVSMHEAADQLNVLLQTIVQKTIDAIEYGLGLTNNQLNNFFKHYQLSTVLDSYLPVTQEKLLTWLPQQQITKTDDGRIETFIPHKDFMPLSILFYRENNCDGLEIKIPGKNRHKEFHTIQLDNSNREDVKALVLSGKVLENLTDNILSGAEHRVVLEPLQKNGFFRRNAINNFIILNTTTVPMIAPIVKAIDGPHYLPVPTETYFAEQSYALINRCKEKALKELSQTELAVYPREEDIYIEDSADGFIYTFLPHS